LLPDELLAGVGIEHEVKARVRRPENDLALRDCRRADHPASRGVEVPLLAAGRRVDRVELRVAAPGVDDAVHDRRRGLEADLVVDLRILAAVKAPFERARLRIDCVEPAVPAAEVDDAVGKRRRRMDDVARLVFPDEVAIGRIDRIRVAVAAAEVDGARATTGLDRNTSNASAIVWFLGSSPCRFFASNRRSPPVSNFQRLCPVFASIAWSLPS
jgi:hypothetical protein